MTVDKQLISRLEHLARLELSEEERTGILKDLNNILQMVEKMNEVNTDNVEPLVYMNDAVNVWREDEVQGQVSREEALKNAPEKNDEFFKVPKMIK